VSDPSAERVPGADRAFIEQRKLQDWVLADHGHGPDFARALGVGLEDLPLVHTALLAHVRENPPEATRPSHPLAGPEARDWSVLGPLEIRGRHAEVRSVWQVAPPAPPRLITAYSRRRRRG
jgi:hypothetical protein